MSMWVNLDQKEVNEILALMPEGSIADKLSARIDHDAEAFVNAVETDDDLEVDPDAVVSRGDDGAFVMSWVWVSNERAGLSATDGDDLDAEGGVGISL